MVNKRKIVNNTKYHSYIRSVEWTKKKVWYWGLTGLKVCQICGSNRNVQVHHMCYDRFGGNEVYDDLLGVCWYCHSEIHKLHRKQGGSLKAATLMYKTQMGSMKFKQQRKEKIVKRNRPSAQSRTILNT